MSDPIRVSSILPSCRSARGRHAAGHAGTGRRRRGVTRRRTRRAQSRTANSLPSVRAGRPAFGSKPFDPGTYRNRWLAARLGWSIALASSRRPATPKSPAGGRCSPRWRRRAGGPPGRRGLLGRGRCRRDRHSSDRRCGGFPPTRPRLVGIKIISLGDRVPLVVGRQVDLATPGESRHPLAPRIDRLPLQLFGARAGAAAGSSRRTRARRRRARPRPAVEPAECPFGATPATPRGQAVSLHGGVMRVAPGERRDTAERRSP